MKQREWHQRPDYANETAQVLEALFGPRPFQKRAARALGISRQMVSAMVTGRRAVTNRRWRVLERIAQFRPDALEQEGKRAAARVIAEYERRSRSANGARKLIEVAIARVNRHHQ